MTDGNFGLTMAQGNPRGPGIFEDEENDAFFANLLGEVNKKLLVTLRDGRTLLGTLRSIDQFMNLVLTEVNERIVIGDRYGDIDQGLMLVRGDNVVVAGEIDAEKEANNPMQKVSAEEILIAQRKQREKIVQREHKRMEAFKERGLQYIPHDQNPSYRLGEDLFN